MGKPIRISDQNKKWNRQGRNRCGERTVDRRALRQRILIVCEGTRTEPNYFESFKKLMPPNVVFLKIEGEGVSTLTLVEKARQIRDERAPGDYAFDQVWVIFDRDSFEPSDFDNAITSAQADNIQCAWSNEAFELWYILHFEYRNTGMSRTEYQGRLDAHLQERYRKNASDMYEKLRRLGNQEQAIGYAKRLLAEAQAQRLPPHQSNPCTTVYRLVEELNRYLPDTDE